MMRLAFYAPFKPLNHARISSDVTIARDAMEFLVRSGHSTSVISPLETTWLYWKPWRWPDALLEYILARRTCSSQGIHAWLTYHSFYKSPDLLGPRLARMGLPYFILSGAYAAERKRSPKTLPGSLLNLRALKAADHIFVNKTTDMEPLQRILPPERLTQIRPGIPVRLFRPDMLMRQKYRRRWGARESVVVTTAAVMRPGVKADGVETVIRACAALREKGKDIMLIVTGDGKERDRLERLAVNLMPGKVRFLGMMPRAKLYEVFSGSDIFAFPSRTEGLGMVYLEAQSCGLPVVATETAAAKEVIRDGETGCIVPGTDEAAFGAAIGHLADDAHLRSRLGAAAREYVLNHHDISVAYAIMNDTMQDIVDRRGHSWSKRA
ncbi:glycosyltransferase family 4 protein [Desulfobaculum senezii]